LQFGTNGLIGGDAAGNDERRFFGRILLTEFVQRLAATLGKNFCHRVLEGISEIGCFRLVCFFRVQAHSGLETGERKIMLLAMHHRARQREFFDRVCRVFAGRRKFFEIGAAGIGQANELRRFIETFAGGIVQRRAPALVSADIFGNQNLRMPAGDQQQQIREFDLVGQARSEGVAFEVIDGEKGNVLRSSNRLAHHHADHHPTDQAGAGGGGDAVEVFKGNPGIAEGCADQRIKMFKMGAGSNLGHYAAKGFMFLELAQDKGGQDIAFVVDDSGGGFITTCFYAEYVHNSPLIKRASMTVKSQNLKIGTRGSPLALHQANMVRAELARVAPNLETEIVVIKTSGDWSPEQGETRLLEEQGGKGLFAKEIEAALLAGTVDIGVHSMKDMETVLPEGLVLEHMLSREDARDALLVYGKHKMRSLDDLPHGAKVGTASVRRMAMLLARRPDLQVTPLRGNVHTRIEKLRTGQVDATLLACAGLKRLGLENEIDLLLEPEDFLPAAGQGAVGIEARKKDKYILAILGQISCNETVWRVMAEREILRILDGSCHTPIGVYAVAKNGALFIRAMIAALDGSESYPEEISAPVSSVDEAVMLGKKLGEKLKEKVPEKLLRQKAI
jgi:hydroxymethylbilane synthase